MFLVLLRCTADDFPIYLAKTRDEAVSVINGCNVQSKVDEINARGFAVISKRSPAYLSIVEFDHERPVFVEVIRDLSSERKKAKMV